MTDENINTASAQQRSASERALYGAADARRDQNKCLLTIARLPPWETGPGEQPVTTGHGLGTHLADILGGGFAQGELIAVSAGSAGFGKTALVAQLVDGIITRSILIRNGAPAPEWGTVLSPVLLISEMSAQQLAWRSAARWLGVDSQMFRGGLSYRERLETDVERAAVDANWNRLVRLLNPDPAVSPFGAAREHWLRRMTLASALEAMTRDTDLFAAHLTVTMREWVDELLLDPSDEGPEPTIYPVVVIDPIQRSQQQDLSDVEALNKLARVLRTCALREGWIVILASDTNKVSATGQTRRETTAVEEAAAAFRGSYGLMHELSAALYMRRPPTRRDLAVREGPSLQLETEIVIAKNRWGRFPRGTPDDPWPRYIWVPEYLRLIPLTREEASRRAWADVEADMLAREQAKAAKEQKKEAKVEEKVEEEPDEFIKAAGGTT